MQYLLPILLAVPAIASLGVEVGGKISRDEIPGAPNQITIPAYWDVQNPAPGTCIDAAHAECLLSNYNAVWGGNYTLVNYTLSANIQGWYNGTGGEAPGAPLTSGRSEYWMGIQQAMLNPNAAWTVVSYGTLYYFVGCQSIAQRWSMIGQTTGKPLHPGQDVPAGVQFEFRGTDLIRVTQEMYNGKKYWMVLQGVTSEDDGNIDYQFYKMNAKLIASGPTNAVNGTGGAGGNKSRLARKSWKAHRVPRY